MTAVGVFCPALSPAFGVGRTATPASTAGRSAPLLPTERSAQTFSYGSSPSWRVPPPAAGIPDTGTSALSTSHVPVWKRVAHYLMHSAHLILEAAEVANVLTGVAMGGAIGAAAISLGMTALGVSHITEGVRNKSGEQVMEGIGATLVGAKSGMDALALSSTLNHSGHSVLGHITHGVHSSLAPLGVAHGAAEVVLGLKRINDGLHEEDRGQIFSGALTVGLGASICASSLGAGIPGILCAGGFLTGRILWEERDSLHRAVKTGKLLARPKTRAWTYYTP